MKDRNLPHSDNWATPDYIYQPLNDEFSFNFDPCPLNPSPDVDGLLIEWGERNFINPPYNVKGKAAFINKAVEEMKKGKLCVLLLPVSTSTKLFHDIILKNISEPIRFFKGRIKFKGYRANGEYTESHSPMHDSMLAIMDGRK
jgi:hypothetical protein